MEKVEAIKAAILGDDDLEILFSLLDEEGMDYDEICDYTEWNKTKLYRLIEKLKRRTKPLN